MHSWKNVMEGNETYNKKSLDNCINCSDRYCNVFQMMPYDAVKFYVWWRWRWRVLYTVSFYFIIFYIFSLQFFICLPFSLICIISFSAEHFLVTPSYTLYIRKKIYTETYSLQILGCWNRCEIYVLWNCNWSNNIILSHAMWQAFIERRVDWVDSCYQSYIHHHY